MKPCPWCGSREGEVLQPPGSTFRWRAWVCGCGVVGPEIRIQTLGEGTREEWEAAARKEALRAWDERKDDVEKLRDVLRRLLQLPVRIRSQGGCIRLDETQDELQLWAEAMALLEYKP
jgi:hypothetical protein